MKINYVLLAVTQMLSQHLWVLCCAGGHVLAPSIARTLTVHFVELWTSFYEYCSLLGRSSNMGF